MSDAVMKACKTHFFFSFTMLEKLVETSPAEIWNLKAGGFVFWQQLRIDV